MTDWATSILLGVEALSQPVNLAIVIVGGLVALGVAGLARRAGLSRGAHLVLWLPVASLLDPGAGLMLLGVAFAATLLARAQAEGDAPPKWLGARAIVLLLAAGALVASVGPWVAAWFDGLSPADKAAVLLIMAAVAPMAMAGGQAYAAGGALLLLVLGIVVQCGPLGPIDPEHTSAMPLLLGLLVCGPVLPCLVWPVRQRLSPDAPAAMEPLASTLGAFLFGLPITLPSALIALNVAENGLQIGPKLQVLRPKLVFGFLAAVLVGLVLAWVVWRLARAMSGRFGGTPPGTAVATRLAGVAVLVLSGAAYYRSGVDQYGEITGLDGVSMATLAVAAVLGALASVAGISLAPLVVGLVIGQFLAPLIGETLAAGDNQFSVALLTGSQPLQALALSAIVLAAGWPLHALWRNGRTAR